MTLNIHAHSAGLYDIADLNLRLDSPAQNRFDARKQLGGFVWLGDIVIGTDFEPNHFVDRAVFCREHDDSHVRRLTNDLANFVATALRQH